MKHTIKLKCYYTFRQLFPCKWPLFIGIHCRHPFLLCLSLQFCVPWEDWTISETGEVVISIMHVHCVCNLRGKYLTNDADLFCSLILSSCSSYFTSCYMTKWKEFFPHKELMQTPRFEAEALCYPKLKIVCEYLTWRQAECK